MVSNQNRFLALPDDDDGTFNEPKVVEAPQKVAAPAKATPAPKKKEATPATTLGYEDPSKGGKPRQGPRGGASNNARGGGRGGGRGAGREGGKREYDRRSASGRPKDGEKKQTVGPGSWGKEGEEKPAEESTEATPAPAGDAPPAEPEEPEEPEEEQKTLEEYKAEVEAARAQNQYQLPATRKAGEGSDNAAWANAVEFERKEEEDFFPTTKTKKDAAVSGKGKKGSEKEVVELEHKGYAPERERGGRGGRGGRGRGNNRGNNNGAPRKKNQAIPEMNDSQFPTLQTVKV